jgi:hypothetical protein
MASLKLPPDKLSGLDILIASKQLYPEIVNWVDIVQVTVDVAVATVGAVHGGTPPDEVKKSLKELNKLTLQQLIDLRNQSAKP